MSIPKELQSLRQWGLYKKIWQPERNKYTKIPYNAIDGQLGKSNDTSTWTDYESAVAGLSEFNLDGLAFYFGNGYMGIDIDHIPEDIQRYADGDRADNIVERVVQDTQSYVETSLSGEGIHAIFKGKVPGNRSRKGNVEMYDKGRFFAMTGKSLGKYADVIGAPDPAKIKSLYTYFFGQDNVIPMTNTQSIETNDLSVDEIIRRAELSKSGNQFKLLNSGGWESQYTSQSEADLAFANYLAFWTGRDFTKMDEIFRNSSLYRPKYDERHGKTTYGIGLLNKAINEAHETFSPKREPLNLYTLNFAESDKTKKKKRELPHRSWDDTGNADRFMDVYGSLVKYSYIDNQWYVYNGSFWEVDNLGKVPIYVDMLVDSMKNEKLYIAEDVDEDEAKKEWAKFLKRSRNNASKKAIIDEVKHRVAILHSEFDTDMTAINTVNGYVDLSSGVLEEHDIKKMFSQQTSIEYTDNIDAPEWTRFLNQIFGGDEELVHYIQKAVGYSATGSIKEQVMFLLFGNGRNGKSIFIDTISDALGTYAKSMQADSIMVRQNKSGANSDIARLENARLVTSSEPNEGVRLDEGLIKQLTGGDKVTARYLYGKEFEFKPQFKLWLATNHKPIIRGTDDGIWRRLMLVPFNIQIPLEKVDKDLKFKLQRELTGILNWIVEGALMWQREGLNPPVVITQASNEYRKEMDVLDLFVDESCEVGEGYKTPAGELFQKYKAWANENSEYLMSKQKFGKEMKLKYDLEKNRVGRFYLGLKVKEDSRLNFLNN